MTTAGKLTKSLAVLSALCFDIITGKTVSKNDLARACFDSVSLGEKAAAEIETLVEVANHNAQLAQAKACPKAGTVESLMSLLQGFDATCAGALQDYYRVCASPDFDAVAQARLLAANLHNIGTTCKNLGLTYEAMLDEKQNPEGEIALDGVAEVIG